MLLQLIRIKRISKHECMGECYYWLLYQTNKFLKTSQEYQSIMQKHEKSVSLACICLDK